MMDTQRLIAFIVFSFSALLLWDAWQKHNAPKAPPVQIVQIGPSAEGRRVFAVTSPAAGDGKTSLALALGVSFAASGA